MRRDAAAILLVDDRDDNLLALAAILEPLERELVSVTSGTAALRELLHRDFALILLDVQMPELDGFETAALIKQRVRTKDVPIIFLTAISKDAEHVFRGYEAGGVDYVMKPLDATILRSKAAVFVELWEKRRQVEEQAEQLRVSELAEVERAGEERYRFLAESIPQQVWTALADGSLDYVNRQVVDYFEVEPDRLLGQSWAHLVHPADRSSAAARWRRSLESGTPYEDEFRLLRASDASYRWHLSRASPFRNGDGKIAKWFGTHTDMHELKRIEERRRFLGDVSAALAISLDDDRMLDAVVGLAVPEIADWAAVSVLDPGGQRVVALRHADPGRIVLLRELAERAAGPMSDGASKIFGAGEGEFAAEIPESRLAELAGDHLDPGVLRAVGLSSYLRVPLVSRGRALGAITLAVGDTGRRYEREDFALAEELARRVAIAVDNVRLYREAEDRAQAAQVLNTVGDGVFLVDRRQVIRLWNTAAQEITGLLETDVVGRAASSAIPGWSKISTLIPVADGPGRGGTPTETVPLELDGRELWLSISGVGFDQGTVYAFRDLTEERAVRQMKADFVATVSHELRTPLAAIHGAAITLRRPGLDEETKHKLLDVAAQESERLANIVGDVLLASHLDSGLMKLSRESCDVLELVRDVVEIARTHAPSNVELRVVAPKRVPPVLAERDQLRRVFVNLVENAIKYSPAGGSVEVEVARAGRTVQVSVRDEGLGIPPADQRRIFEKFYRLDPNMTRGIGGTGLGLYICRELVRRLNGRIWVESDRGPGSRFVVELPRADAPKAARVAAKGGGRARSSASAT
ncbi:MAG: ATP-binding protein [Gaiellaceae bacterium]